MRSRAHRYKTSTSGTTFSSGAEAIGVTGDFEGGFVQANAQASCNVGVGQWMTMGFIVDGVQQGNGGAFYQSAASASLSISDSLRISQGRHRIGLKVSFSTPPAAGSNNAELSVTETGA